MKIFLRFHLLFLQYSHVLIKEVHYQYQGSPLMGLFNHQPLKAEGSISPNPANDEVYFDVIFGKSQEVNVLVNDQMGRMIRRLEFAHGQDVQGTIT